uniref:Homeobox domain-containing protein n=1 Tax=Mola mola TaxID=94237 RepID=A0A3Q3WTB8_MOLML
MLISLKQSNTPSEISSLLNLLLASCHISVSLPLIWGSSRISSCHHSLFIVLLINLKAPLELQDNVVFFFLKELQRKITNQELNTHLRKSCEKFLRRMHIEVGFSSGTEEETSGYESEGGRSLSPSAHTDCTSASSPPSPLPGRRPRTAFTAEQISSMERAFKRNAYLGTQDKAELCKKLNLSDKQVTTINLNWFQNRRMKLKRTVQDALAQACQANVASQLMHYPELQAYRPGPYPRYHSAGAAATAELPPPTSYIHPHSLQYSAALPLDPFYQYSSLPAVMLPSATAPLVGSYPTYPQYY